MFKVLSLEKILTYYFLIVIVTALIALMGGKQYLISVFFPILLFSLAYKYGCGRKNLFDLVFFSIILLMVLTWLTNSYPHKSILIFRCIMAEGSYMAAYFAGKHLDEKYFYEIFKKSIIPLAVCCVLGIYFFFQPPGWYLEQLYESKGAMLPFESLRLRSIFSSPYTISYMCGLISIYLFFRIFKYSETRTKNYIVCGLFFITMCLCMMRAPLSSVILSFSILLCYYSIKKGSIKNILWYVLFVIIILGVLSFVLQHIDTDMLYFMFDKFDAVVNEQDEFVDRRLNMWDYKYDIWGDGAGRHAYVVQNFDEGESTSIADSEYIKIIVELGYIGLCLYIVFLALCVIKSIRYFKYLSLEFCIILFFAVCMIGANPLSTADKHCFVFWMAAGRIAAFKNSRGRLRNSELLQNDGINNGR